ncbi:MAG: chemotaxis protein CheW [Cellvibrio sp.]|uniref:chemotaxis protein CheW n=1 Tax=Cellvibrio sp. TaxID=1965322 RepID=UPI0031A35783
MTKRKDSGDGIRPPDDSLSNYFDDLLGGEDLLDHALAAMDERPMPLAAGSGGGARVVSLPTKKNLEEQPKKPALRAEPKPKSVPKPVAAFVEPEPVQTLEQKLKLEKLLQSARTQLLVETPVVTEVAVEVKAAFVSDPQEIQDWVIEAPVVEVVSPEIIEEPQVEATTQPAPYQIDGLEWLENGLPQWAQSRFDVLLFKVSGLTLAVPLISLGQIQPLTDELTPLFGQADWFMGLQPTPAGKIRTVNTAKFVMPERYDETFLETAKYVVSINGVPWGLAVDSVNQPITLQPDDVKWRGDRSKRPWLAGTVKEHMCALLDIPRIGQMLIDADKNFMRG